MRGIRIIFYLGLLLLGYLPVHAQLSMDKVKNIFGKKEESKVEAHLQFLASPAVENRTSGSASEQKVTDYISQQFSTMLFKPYLGKFVHPFRIDKKNNLSTDSYLRIFNKDVVIGSEIVIPPFSGTGELSVQALPGMNEPDNLWFIKFSEVGTGLNNPRGNGLEKLHRAAKEAIANGAQAVMFINDQSVEADFAATFTEKKTSLGKPIFILNHAAYKKYLLQEARGKDWVTVDYDFSTTRRTMEGRNVVGYWRSQSPLTVVIAARMDKLPGQTSNASGLAALLDVAERINHDRLTKYNYVIVGLSGTSDGRIGADALLKKLKLTSSNVNCVINIGDIGAIDNSNQLFISGMGTAANWDMVSGSFTRNFMLNKIPTGDLGQDNHITFYKNEIPVINIFTKRKGDDARNNAAGVANVATSIGDMLVEIENLPKFKFTKTKALPNLEKINSKVNMGIVPDYAFGGSGVLIGTVRPGSPAELSRVQDGDVLIKMDDYDIKTIDDYIREIAKYKKGDRIMIKVNRAGTDKQMLITFR